MKTPDKLITDLIFSEEFLNILNDSILEKSYPFRNICYMQPYKSDNYNFSNYDNYKDYINAKPENNIYGINLDEFIKIIGTAIISCIDNTRPDILIQLIQHISGISKHFNGLYTIQDRNKSYYSLYNSKFSNLKNEDYTYWLEDNEDDSVIYIKCDMEEEKILETFFYETEEEKKIKIENAKKIIKDLYTNNIQLNTFVYGMNYDLYNGKI
jgi:hypothetical protein